MSFGCWINPDTGKVTDDHLVAKAIEALRCEFGQKIDFELFVKNNLRRAYLVLGTEDRTTAAVVNALRPFAQGMASAPYKRKQKRLDSAEKWRKTNPQMARLIEKGML